MICTTCHHAIYRDDHGTWVDDTGGDVCMNNDGVDGPHIPRVIRPTRPWRIIRGAGGNYKDQRYTTKERRDAAAQRFADRDGTNVITELWDESHPQDGLNRGWACDGHRAPTPKENR